MSSTLAKFAPGTGGVAQLRQNILVSTEPDNTPQQNMEMYDSWAAVFDQDMALVPNGGPANLAGYVAKYQEDKKGKILDIGAGTGLLGVEIHKAGFSNLDAVEASAGMCEQARKRGFYGRVINDFVGKNRLDIEDETYDIVTGAGVFIPQHITADAFDEINRVLKPSGYFILFCSDKYKAEKYGFFSQSLDKRAKEFTDKGLWVEISKESIHHFDMYNADVTVFKKN